MMKIDRLKFSVRLLALTVSLGMVMILSSGCATEDAASHGPKKILVVTVTKGFHHDSIKTGEKIIANLAQSSGEFTVDFAKTDEDLATKMTVEALKGYDGVMFLSTTGILPLPDKQGFLDWIKTGKAFIGTHSATDTFHAKEGVDPYIDMIGGEFQEHHDQATVECHNEDPAHPATQAIGSAYTVKDEIYIMKNFSKDRVHNLLGLDKHPNTGAPGYYPICWCKKYGKGNVFYTSLGHRDDVWESPTYQAHLLGGIEWALGLKPGSSKPGNPVH